MQWLNEPPRWHADGNRLWMTTGPQTDFWRTTHYGFIRDSGHFYGESKAGDFTARVIVRGKYEALYDQAGLMLRADARDWIKAGIEMTDDVAHLSVVVTRECSDWSVIPLPELRGAIELRLSRHGAAIRVEYRPADPSQANGWRMARLAYFPHPSGESAPFDVGVMACSPQRTEGPGFEAEFEGFVVGQAISPQLHQG